MNNTTKQYRVTYDSKDRTFIVPRKEVRIPNREFEMHSSGLHVYQPNAPNEYIRTFITKSVYQRNKS